MALLLFLLVQLGNAGQIYFWDMSINYDYQGDPQTYNFKVKLESGLGASDFFKIQMPVTIGAFGDVSASLYNLENDRLIQKNVAADSNSAGQVYYFSFGKKIEKENWLLLQISSVTSAASGIYDEPIQLFTQSSVTANTIIYDQNRALSILNIYPNIAADTATVSVVYDTTLDYNLPLQNYFINIQITPTIDMEEGASISVKIYDHGAGDGNDVDFIFTGQCYSYSDGTYQAVKGTCKISDDNQSFVFENQKGYLAVETFVLKVKVKNPEFISTRGIVVTIFSPFDGKPIEKGSQTGVLEVSAIDLTAGKIKYYWGISTSIASSSIGTIPLVPFKAASGGQLGPLNSITIGFFTQVQIPQGLEFTVKINIEATGVMEGSFLTNLPAYDDEEVRCEYTSPYIICYNVGSLVYDDLEYYVAVKAFYSDSAGDPTDFGEIVIESVNYDEDGAEIAGMSLVNSLAGSAVVLQQNTEYLDTAGWHDRTQFGFGTTQVLTYFDDNTLSATPNAVENIMSDSQNARNKVGIFPRDSLEEDQQILFFLKVNTADMGSNGAAEVSRMEVLFNSEVITVEEDYKDLGIDYASYYYDSENAIYEWNLDGFTCFFNSQCVQYSKTNTIDNTILYEDESTLTKPYGIVNFECGVYATTGNAMNTYCDNFKGYGTTVEDAGVFAIRHVSFASDFHSNIYPDQKLLDFVIAFSSATYSGSSLGTYSLQSAQLINAYTLESSYLENIKVSYVNFYGHASNINEGQQIPMMLRIAGNILKEEHDDSATIMGVFVDINVDASTFYEDEDDKSDYSIGCSTGSCKYYGNINVDHYSTDAWVTNKMAIIQDLPDIENDFDILIPFQSTAANTYPHSVYVGFFDENYTANDDVPNKLRTISVYRVYGPTVDGLITEPLEVINGLTLNADTTLDFTANWVETGGDSFNYQIEVNKIYPGGSDDILVQSNGSSVTNSAGKVILGQETMWGGGITVTSMYYDIFTFASVEFFGYEQKCTTFSYVKNGGAAILDGKHIYVAFCPIDSEIDIPSNDADIMIFSPDFPENFVENYPLDVVFNYAMSDNTGKIIAYTKEAQIVPSITRECISEEFINTIYSDTTGKQEIQIPITFPSNFQFDGDSLIGFSEIKITVTFSASVSGITFGTTCQLLTLDQNIYTCTLTTDSSTYLEYKISIAAGNTDKIIQGDEILIQQYISTDSSTVPPTSGLSYSVVINLPTYDSGSSENILFGDDYEGTNPAVYCTADSGSVGISDVALETEMTVGSLKFSFYDKEARGEFQFSFSPYSDRETFFADSYFEVNFGFLSNFNDGMYTDNGFRCVVFENEEEISWQFLEIDLSDMTQVKIYPKEDIQEPDQYVYIMKCFGGGVPDGSVSTQISAISVDDLDGSTINTLATINNIDFPSYIITTSKAFGVSPTVSKMFYTQGFAAFYTFTITSANDLDYNSKIYVEFSLGLNDHLNRSSNPDCYISLAGATEYIQTNCEYNGEKQLKIDFNKEVTAGTAFYLDIFGIEQPISTDITVNSNIWIGLDVDDDIYNGLDEHGTVVDIAPITASTTSIDISNILLSTNQIRADHDLSFDVTLPAGTVVASNSLYIDFTSSISSNIYRGQQMTCNVVNSATSSDFISSCTFISKSRLKLELTADAANSGASQNYVVTVENLPSPSYLPIGIENQIKFLVFTADYTSSDDAVVLASYENQYEAIGYQLKNELEDLQYDFYQYVRDSEGQIEETFLGTGEAEVYIGYYKTQGKLSTVSGDNFSADFNYSFEGDSFVFDPSKLKIKTGMNYNQFKIGAQQTTEPGVYILKSSKNSGDQFSDYMDLPPVKIIVKNNPCLIQPADSSYTIPIGGKSQPIVFDFYNCFPVDDLQVTATFSDSQAYLDSDFSNTQIDSTKQDERLFFFVTGDSTIADGTVITMSFVVSGTNQDSFVTPEDIDLVFVDANSDSYNFNPLATSISGTGDIVVDGNDVALEFSCDQPATIYWAIGVNPSLNSLSLSQIKEKVIIYDESSILSNYTETEDYFEWKVYGFDYSTSMLPVQKNFYNLRSDSTYDIIYYCENQMGLVSQASKSSFDIADNGGYLLKVIIYTEEYLSYSQVTDVACALNQIFQISDFRVFTEISNICGEQSALMGAGVEVSDNFVKDQDEEGYPYYFYIMPDKSLDNDSINLVITESVQQYDFDETIISKLQNSDGFPSILDISSEKDIDSQIPELQIDLIEQRLNALVISLHLENLNGYIYVGVKEGEFSTLQNELPSLQDIREGRYGENKYFKNLMVQFGNQDQTLQFAFGNLKASTAYTVFFAASNDDTTYLASRNEVNYYVINTKDKTEVYYANGEILQSIGVYVIVFILGVLFV